MSALIAYDLPESVALVRHEVAANLRRYGRVIAPAFVATANTRDAWEQLAAECEGLGSYRSGTYDRSTLAYVCERMARGQVDAAVARMAAECGMGVEEWEADTRREMAKAVSL